MCRGPLPQSALTDDRNCVVADCCVRSLSRAVVYCPWRFAMRQRPLRPLATIVDSLSSTGSRWPPATIVDSSRQAATTQCRSSIRALITVLSGVDECRFFLCSNYYSQVCNSMVIIMTDLINLAMDVKMDLENIIFYSRSYYKHILNRFYAWILDFKKSL